MPLRLYSHFCFDSAHTDRDNRRKNGRQNNFGALKWRPDARFTIFLIDNGF